MLRLSGAGTHARWLAAALIAVSLAAAARTHGSSSAAVPVTPLFDPTTLDRAPFPSDALTAPDAAQVTGLRVKLPRPDCAVQPSNCEDIAILDTLDGFNVRPRVSIPFNGAIDISSVTSKTVVLVRLSDARVTPVDQIVWDPASNVLHAIASDLLDEHTRYALVVTRGVRDAGGASVAPSAAFTRFRQTTAGPYRQALVGAVAAADRAGIREPEIAVASVFTTQTFSHVLSRMREAVQRAPAPKLDFAGGPDRLRTVFDAATIESLTNHADINPGGTLTEQSMAQQLTAMRAIPGAVGTLAFGTFRALDFTVHPSGHIAPIATRTGTLTPTGSMNVAFDLWMPAGAAPPRGWPVVMCGAGSMGDKNTCFVQAAVFASHGLAVIGPNTMGRGRGPRTTMTVKRRDGTTMTFAAPGLGYDADGDGTIVPYEPIRAQRPYAILNTSGPMAQAASVYFDLVRGIQAGVDVDGDGRTDLDASRIYYYGQSLGSNWGMLSFAHEPAIRAAAFVVPTGSLAFNLLVSPQNRPGLGSILAARAPSQLNEAKAVRTIDGVEVAEPGFNDNLPLPGAPGVVNDVPGALDVQRVVDRIAWCAQMANHVAVAPMLRRAPRSAVPPRPFLVQAARGDQISANPGLTELVRAGDFADRVAFYRHDLNAGAGVPPNPHGFASAIAAAPAISRVALGAQHQIGRFFESDGKDAVHPEPADLWEWPIKLPLPADTFFLPRPR